MLNAMILTAILATTSTIKELVENVGTKRFDVFFMVATFKEIFNATGL